MTVIRAYAIVFQHIKGKLCIVVVDVLVKI